MLQRQRKGCRKHTHARQHHINMMWISEYELWYKIKRQWWDLYLCSHCWGKEILNLAQASSLLSNDFNAFIFTGICLYIWVPYKGAVTSPCTICRSNTKTGDNASHTGQQNPRTAFLCSSWQQVLSGSTMSPCSTLGGMQWGVLQNWGPTEMILLIFLKIHWAMLNWTRLEGSRLKCAFMKLGKAFHGSFKSPFWSLDAVAK